MKQLKAYRVFEFEIKELVKFLRSTKYAFTKIGDLRNFAKDQNHKQYLEENGFDTSPSGVCNFKKNSVLNLEKTLNQQTLVRVISALEIFLVDVFRDVFIQTKTPFKDNLKIHQFSQAKLLSLNSISELFNEIINKECRNLSSGGFDEINKVYKKKLGINLLQISPGKNKMVEYHEVRHLVVHKLGRTDSNFRKKYKLNDQGGVTVDDQYLSICINDIKGFAEQTHKLVLRKIDDLKTPCENRFYERKVKYFIEILDQSSNLDFLNTDFEFWVNDEFEVLNNILIESKKLNENESEIVLAGTRRQIKSYYSWLKYAKKNRVINLKIIEDSTNPVNFKNNEENSSETHSRRGIPERGESVSVGIDEKTLELIRQQLPDQPWETGVHKEVARKLGLNNKRVSNAIKILIGKGVFKKQVGGILVENGNNEN